MVQDCFWFSDKVVSIYRTGKVNSFAPGICKTAKVFSSNHKKAQVRKVHGNFLIGPIAQVAGESGAT